MAFQKGNPGRPRGSFNKHSTQALEIAMRLQIDPFEVLCLFAKGDWKALGYENEVYVKETASGAFTLGYTITPDMRLHAAKEACKYVYAQKKEVELSPQEMKIIELFRERLILNEESGMGSGPQLLGQSEKTKP